MAEENEKRINIDDIPKAEEELTEEDAKNVAGGTFYGSGVYKTTDAGRTWAAGNTVGGSLGSASGNTVGGSLGNDIANPGRKMGDGSV